MTTRYGIWLLALPAGAALLFGLALGRPALRPIEVEVRPAEILADGYDEATLTVEGPASAGALRVSIIENVHGATVAEADGRHAKIRAGVLPGRVVLRVEAAGFLPARVELQVRPVAADRVEDVLRLDDEHDQGAFRRWFVFLAEAQYFQTPAAEIRDCAGLIRYAYREALRSHDSRWAAEARLPVVPALDSVTKYQYPYTPLHADLFRVGSGFAQFADAQTLWRFNTHFVSRDVSRALPGDLLFYRRRGEHDLYHSMIFLGPSPIGGQGGPFVLYHTGPEGAVPGEMRRPTVGELLRHPEPQWRPAGANPVFLGVYRWNILRKALP